MLTTPSLEIPPADAFTCARCNQCCKGSWRISISQQEATSLRAIYPEIEPVDRIEMVNGNEMLLMARVSDGGACIYLDDDGCRIQKQHGAAAKPAVCRSFPYFARQIGDKTYVHLSRMCPTVYDGRGASGAKLLADIRGSVDAPTSILQPITSVPFSGAKTLGWDDYIRFESMLVSLLEDERWPLDDAVYGGYLLIERVANGDGVPQATPELPMDLVMSAISRRRPMHGLYRYIISSIVTIIEKEPRGKNRVKWSYLDDVRRYWKILLRKGAGRFRSISHPVELGKIATIPWPRRDKPDLRPLRRYLASHILHKVLLDGVDVEYAYHLLMGAYATIKFYARASAAAAGRESLHPQDLRCGIETVEYNFLLHRSLEGAPLEKGLVRGFFRKFLFHPAFPSSMVTY